MRKKAVKKIKHTRKYKRTYKGLSWISVIILIFLLSLVFGGFAIMPLSKNNAPNPQEYIKVPLANCESGDNLQLCTFIILSLTPTPEPTPESTSTFRDRGSSGGSSRDRSSSGDHGGSPNSGGSGSSGGSGGGGAPPL